MRLTKTGILLLLFPLVASATFSKPILLASELITPNGKRFVQIREDSKSEALFWSVFSHDVGFVALPGRIVGFALKQWFDFSSTAYVRHAGILQERVWVDPKSGAKLAIQHRLDQIHSPEFELGGTFTHPDVLKPYELSFYRNPAFVKLRDAEIALTEEYIALSKSGQDIYAEIMLEFRRKRLAQVFNEQRSDPTETCSAQLRTSKN